MSERSRFVPGPGSSSILPGKALNVVDDLPPIPDYYRWAFDQAEHLRAGRLDQIDLLNVADEMEDVGKSEFNGFVNELTIILLHMLKWDHQEGRRSRSWEQSIGEHRGRITRRLADSPSLKSKRASAVDAAYDYARRRATAETNMPIKTFPAPCPYSWDDIVDRPFDFDPD